MAHAQVPALQEEAIVDAAWLRARLDDPAVRVIEVDVTGARYQQGHIPGAVLWNAYTDLHHSDYSPLERDELESLLETAHLLRSPDFRWLLDRQDSPWYPTARLFRQPSIGDWESTIRNVTEALSA